VNDRILHNAEQEIAHYFLNDVDILTGKITKDGKFLKKKGRSQLGKGKLGTVFKKIRKLQSVIKKLELKPEKNKEELEELSSNLSKCRKKHSGVLDTLAKSIAAKVRDIAVYYKAKYPDYTVRVQVEDLSWRKNASRTEAGYYIAHNQTHLLFGQVQRILGGLLRLENIGLWKVNPRGSSYYCALCGYRPNKDEKKETRQGRAFTCQNHLHKLQKHQNYTCNSDLNAARNIGIFPPKTLKPVNSLTH